VKRWLVTLLAAVCTCPALLAGVSAAAATPAGAPRGHWGTAEEMPGIAALSTGDYAVVNSISCASPGNCSAVGRYNVSSSTVDQQAFVASQTHGTWGRAEKVPGTTALNKGGFASVFSVSCPSAGNCGAGGFYAGSGGYEQALVVSEVNGVWGSAEQVPGTATLNAGGGAAIYSVSCPGPGDCSAGGSYLDASLHAQAFTVGETNGVWGTAREVPGTAALNAGGSAEVEAVSCAEVNRCSAGGFYMTGSGDQVLFVAGER
jgi:hypothetical protein